MKLTIDELVENVTEELLCYEEMEQAVKQWESEFRSWVENNKGKNKDIVIEHGSVFFKISDEEDVFEIANSYMDAMEEGSVKEYWTKF